MIKLFFRKCSLHVALAVVLFGSLIFPPPETKGQTAATKRALVISLDGLDARYLHDADKYKLRIPTLRRLMTNGITARGMISVYPSITYPNHTSLVTGAMPAKHGIFGNSVFLPPDEPQTGLSHWFARDIKADTLWDAAKRAGMTVGMVSFPVRAARAIGTCRRFGSPAAQSNRHAP